MFHQISISNPKWYESFNRNCDVSKYIIVTHQHNALQEYVTQETHSLDFDSYTEYHQAAVRIDSE